MSNDTSLIERLRTRPTGDPYVHMMVHEAADELERLTRELEAARKKAALYEVVRRMNVAAFTDAYVLNRRTGKPFDEIIADLAPFYGLPHPDAQEK